jgi:hypothetical protein
MKPKPGSDLEELRRLARQEAVAYQSMSGWYPARAVDPVSLAVQYALHDADCGAAAAALRERTEWAGWDHARECASDVPDLMPTWRVSVVSQNPTFPPLVRCQAFRTILPDELPDQLARWRRWVEGVVRGDHDAYLRELHWYSTADWAWYHWSCLHAAATASLAAPGAWASKPELVEVREAILRLAQPTVPGIAVSPDPGRPSPDRDKLETAYPATLTTAHTLAELTRRWDRCVRENRKLKYYEGCYRFALDEFREHASGRWLGEFFAWTGRCAELGFGLGLDS